MACSQSKPEGFIIMAIGGVTLSNGLRNGLSSLQLTNDSIDKSNFRLATGKKVNSALDNALSFFTAQGLTDRANNFSNIADSIGQGIGVFNSANKALDSIKTLLDSAAGTLKLAQQSVSTSAKIVSSQSYVNAATGLADPTALVAGAGTNDIGVGDNFTIQLTGGIAVAATAILAAPVAAGTTVQNVIDGINNNVTLNPVANQPLVRASLNDAGNIVIESTRSDVNVVFAQSTNGGGANALSSTFSYSGSPITPPTTPSGAAGAQTLTISSSVNATRSAAAQTFKTLLGQADQLAKDAGYNGTNLLNGDALTLYFNETNTTSLTTRGTTLTQSSLGLGTDNQTGLIATASRFGNDPTSTTNGGRFFQSDAEIKNQLTNLTNAVTSVRSLQASFSSNLTVVKTRQDFTKAQVKTFDNGADDLVAADINQEGANLTSLQTRQQLAVQALSLASRSDQAILRLF
jgi:flagellin